MTSVFWFRRDVRLDDNPGLSAAVSNGLVVPLFVLDPVLLERCSPHRRSLLLAGLADLDSRLIDLGGRLRVETGDPFDVVPEIVADTGAELVHVSGEVTPYGRQRDERVATRVDLVEHDGIYAVAPGEVLTGAGTPYLVFTPFHRAWSEQQHYPADLPVGAKFSSNPGAGLPQPDQPPMPAGPTAAGQRLRDFQNRVDLYDQSRDRIDLDATSGLSIDLKYGWIGPRRILAELDGHTPGRRMFARQIGWRDFYGHLLATRPEMVDTSLKPRYRQIPWRNDPDDIEAWKTGQTGFPIVDASMRRLVAEGQMHNRARMIVGSFLVKDLLVDWRIGERFFRHHLIDGDVAQNAGNWQWVAGTGTDSAPYFRVFNPTSQSKKFDPEGTYIKRWVGELADLDARWVHAPWLAPQQSLGASHRYPEPIVDHAMARERALEAYTSAVGSP